MNKYFKKESIISEKNAQFFMQELVLTLFAMLFETYYNWNNQ